MAIITLTTDFGSTDHYVGVMKGVILGIDPTVTVVDITHQVGPQNLYHAAVVLANAVAFFPAGTIHVAVVDPGVGSGRRILLVETRDQFVLAPDNGVATRVLETWPIRRITAVTEARFFRGRVSRTFHGRDVFAPVAAHLAKGLRPERLGPAVDDPFRLAWPRPTILPGRVQGQVLYADHFGNLVTNIDGALVAALGEGGRSSEMPRGVRAAIGDRTAGLVGTYAEAPPGTLVALVGSCDLVEVSQVQGSAQEALGVGAGTPVVLTAVSAAQPS